MARPCRISLRHARRETRLRRPVARNPKCPESEKEPERVDLIALTHGHDDHVGGTVELAQKFDCPVVALIELRGWLSTKGLPEEMDHAGNKGGTIDVDGVRITLTNAHHSSSAFESETFVYLGEAVRARDRGRERDVALLRRRHLRVRRHEAHRRSLQARCRDPADRRSLHDGSSSRPLYALELLGVKRCVPCHYGTFPILRGTPAELRRLAPGVEIISPEPGETVEL